MKYNINYKDMDIDETTYTGVERSTFGNGFLYLWGPMYRGRNLDPIAKIPLDQIIDYTVEDEDE